jgi:hypothetical protein
MEVMHLIECRAAGSRWAPTRKPLRTFVKPMKNPRSHAPAWECIRGEPASTTATSHLSQLNLSNDDFCCWMWVEHGNHESLKINPHPPG